jgi:hypothetical protein
MDLTTSAPSSFSALQDVLRRKPVRAAGERCDYCAVPVGAEHGHVVDLESRRILCACRPCYIVFEPRGAAQGRFRPVPTRYVAVDLAFETAEWDALGIPIGLAFLFYNSVDGKLVAFYPGAAGATESLLPLEGWQAIAGRNLTLATLAPDVEAVVIDARSSPPRCFIVPIDSAYELVGRIRTLWRGFDGGAEAQEAIERYFASVVDRSLGRVTAPRT